MSSSMLDWFLSTLTPTEAQVNTSTADFVQRYISLNQITEEQLKRVNPFDIKFREANQQISSGEGSALGGAEPLTAAAGDAAAANGLVTPTICASGGIPLPKLPAAMASQSPNIFSNISVLSAAENVVQKSLDISRTIQQLRDNGAFNRTTSTEEGAPCTADVIKGVLDVLDMNPNAQQGCSPGTQHLYSASTAASLAAGFSASMAAAVAAASSQQQQQQQQLASLVGDARAFHFTCPSLATAMRKGGLSQAEQLATTTAALLQQQQQQQQMLSPETLMALQSSASAAQRGACLAVPPLLTSAHSSPASTAISPHAKGLKKASSSADLQTCAGGDGWDSAEDVKPTIGGAGAALLLQVSPPGSEHGFYAHGGEAGSSGFGDGPRRPKLHAQRGRELQQKARKYTKYSQSGSGGSANDSQVSSTRGGRGRRSMTAELPPDERRSTILERNKAAAVRYRKRKKEEHDEMMGRVQDIEQEKSSLATRNQVLTRELERLTALLKARDANCVCRARHLAAGVGGLLASAALDADASPRGAAAGDTQMSAFTPHHHQHQQHSLRPSSQHSMHSMH